MRGGISLKFAENPGFRSGKAALMPFIFGSQSRDTFGLLVVSYGLVIGDGAGETKNSWSLFLIEVFHLFLTIVSVLPGKNLEISAHLFPSTCCFSNSMRSSSCVHGPLLILGLRCPFHRSLICLAERPRTLDS